MASLVIEKSYLPKCKLCGRSITYLEWRIEEICRYCLKKFR